MSQDHRTLTPEVAEFYATSLQDVFTPDGDAGVIDDLYQRISYQGIPTGWRVRLVGQIGERWFSIDELTYDHTEYLRVKAARDRDGI